MNAAVNTPNNRSEIGTGAAIETTHPPVNDKEDEGTYPPQPNKETSRTDDRAALTANTNPDDIQELLHHLNN